MAALKSEGKCVFCNTMVAKSAITKHLNAHLKELEKQAASTEKVYHIRVEAAEMFLQILIASETTLQTLDGFLRAIWLECCGHMSSFELSGKSYHTDWDDDFVEIGEPKSTQCGALFQKGMKIDYEYDMGSTTALIVKVLEEYQLPVAGGLELLSRNEPLPIMCHTCSTAVAVTICSVDFGLFCKKCAKKHAKECEDFADYAELPVCNSPRMGVCAYEGGEIDTARDGIYKLPK